MLAPRRLRVWLLGFGLAVAGCESGSELPPPEQPEEPDDVPPNPSADPGPNRNPTRDAGTATPTFDAATVPTVKLDATVTPADAGAADVTPLPPINPGMMVDPGKAPSGDYQAEEVPGSPSFEGTGLVWWGDRLVIADRGKKKLFTLTPPSTFAELPGVDLQDPTGVAIDAQGNLLVPDCGPCLSDKTRPSRVVRVGRDGKSSVHMEMPVPTQDLVAHRGGLMYWGGFDHGQVRAGAPGTPVFALSPTVGHSYGVALSPAHDVLFASSKLPGTRKLFRFPLGADGMPGAGEVLMAIEATTPEGKSLGRIQGITVDALGNVYMVGAESQVNPAVVVVSPAEKKVIAMVRCSSNRVDVAFGDADRRTLYITGGGKLQRARLPVAGTVQ